jgi:tape measure domain-containing protein
LSAILHSELFDFPSYEKAIGEARKQTQLFASTVGGVMKELLRRQQDYNTELAKYISVLNSYNVANTNSLQVLRNINNAVSQAVNGKAQLTNAQVGLTTVTNATTASQKALELELKKLKSEYDALDKSNQNYRAELDRINKRLAEIIPNVHRFSEIVKTTKKTLDASGSSYKSMSTELSNLKAKLQSLPGAFNATTGAINKTNKEAVALQHKIETLDKAVKKADNAMGNYGRNVGNYKSAFSGLGAQLLGVAGPLALATTLLAGFNKLLSANVEFQTFEAGLRAVVDSEKELGDTISFLRSIADKYGQDLNDLARGYKGLTAASKGTSIEGAETKRIFESIIQAGTALKLTNVQVEGTLRAIQQMMSKGKVSAEELRQQLGEHLPGAFNIFAQAAGVGTSQLDKLLRQGKIVAADILPKVADILEKTYGKKAIENAQQLTNETNRLTNAFNKFLVSFGSKSGVIDFWAEAKKGMTAFFNNLTYFTNSPSFKTFFGLFNGDNSRAVIKAQLQEQDFSNFQSQNATGRNEIIKDKTASVSVAKNIMDNATGKRFEQAKKAYAEAVKEQKRYVEAAKQLDYEEAHNAVRHTQELKDNRDANNDDAKTKGEDALEELKKRIAREQELLRRQAELDIKLAEQAAVDKDITEKEFQERKYFITTTYLEKSIEKELELGKNADDAKIDNLKKQIIDAEIEISRFLQKYREDRNKGQTISTLNARSSAVTDRGIGNSQESNTGDIALQSAITTEQRRMDVERLRRNVSFKEEMDYLDRMKQLHIGNADAIAEIEQEQLLITEEHRRDTIDTLASYAAEAADMLFSQLEENQQIRSENRIAQLEFERDRELDLAGNNAAAKEKIEKDFQKRINAEKTKQAKQEKTMALFEIGVQTAIAIAKSIAESPLTFGLPFSAFALAQGAFQAALVASRPLPKFYAKGTKSAASGKAVIGEEGFELMERNGRMYVAKTPQLIDMKGGERVWSHEESKRIIDHALSAENNIADKATHLITSQINQGKRSESIELLATAIGKSGIDAHSMRDIMEDTVGNIVTHQTIFDERGVRRAEKRKNGLTVYLNEKHKYG